MLFAWQLWRWVNHLPFGARGAWGQMLAMWRHGRGRKAAKAVRVAPERTGDQERRLSQLRAAVIAVEAVNQLNPPACTPTLRPEVAPAGEPDAPCLARCASAAAALAAELAAAPGFKVRRAIAVRLGKRFQLCWETGSSGSMKEGPSCSLGASK